MFNLRLLEKRNRAKTAAQCLQEVEGTSASAFRLSARAGRLTWPPWRCPSRRRWLKGSLAGA